MISLNTLPKVLSEVCQMPNKEAIQRQIQRCYPQIDKQGSKIYVNMCMWKFFIDIWCKAWGSYHPNVSSQSSQLRFGILTSSVTKSSLLVLRNVLYILTLKFSVYPKPPSNVTVQSIHNCPKMPPNRWKWNTNVVSFLILNLNYFDIACLHFLIFKCFISSILILKKP